MKLFLIVLLAFPSFDLSFKGPAVVKDSAMEEARVRLIASVTDTSHEYLLIAVEEIVSYSSTVHATPNVGDEIYVRLAGGGRPDMQSRIDVDLQEKVEVGEIPCAYVMVDYRTLDYFPPETSSIEPAQ